MVKDYHRKNDCVERNHMKEHGGLTTSYVVICLVRVSEASLGLVTQPGCHLEAAELVTLANAL